MNKIIIVILLLVFVLSGCANVDAVDIDPNHTESCFLVGYAGSTRIFKCEFGSDICYVAQLYSNSTDIDCSIN